MEYFNLKKTAFDIDCTVVSFHFRYWFHRSYFSFLTWIVQKLFYTFVIDCTYARLEEGELEKGELGSGSMIFGLNKNGRGNI